MPNTLQTLKQAISVAEQIQKLEAELAGILKQIPRSAQGDESPSPFKKGFRKKPKFSKAARARIAEAQRKRWSKIKRKQKPATKAKKPKTRKRRKMSAGGRANIVKAQKARWAKIRAEKKKVA